MPKYCIASWFGSQKTAKIIGSLLLIVLMGGVIYKLLLLKGIDSCQSFNVSDWMITYGGGFVRRGLIGEFLYSFERVAPFDIRWIIGIMEIIFCLVLLLITLMIFRKAGWSPAILLSGIMPFAVFFFHDFWIRRDHLSLLLMIGIFYSFSKAVQCVRGSDDTYNSVGNTRHMASILKWAILFEILSVGTILIHEASFFYSIPVLGLSVLGRKAARGTAVVLLSLPVAAFTATCIFKGNEDTAAVIWNRWAEVLGGTSGFDPETIGEGVEALGWSVGKAAELHLRINFTPYPIFHIAATILVLWCVVIVLQNINVVSVSWYPLQRVSKKEIAAFALFQFVCLVPMFSVLSCDWARTLPYWGYSTIMAYHFFSRTGIVWPGWFITAVDLLFPSRLKLSPLIWIIMAYVLPFLLSHGFWNSLQRVFG